MKSGLIFCILCAMAVCGSPADAAPAPADSAAVRQDKLPYIERPLDIVNREGHTIKGTVFIPDKGHDRYPLAIMSHGFNGTYREPLEYAKAAASKGVAAYVFDFIDGGKQSRSGNNTLKMNVMHEVGDIEDIVASAREWDFVEPESMSLLGCSQGGLVTALASSRHPEWFKSIVLAYPALTIPDTAPMMLEKFDADGGRPQMVMGVTLSRSYYEAINGVNVYDSIPAYKNDVLIIYGDRDFVAAGAEKSSKIYNKPHTHVIEGGNHGFREAAHMKEASERISDFLAATLTLRPDRMRHRFDAANPDVHDPVLAYEDGRYYLFNTGMGISMLSSDDMKTWRREKAVLDPAPEWAKTPVPAYRGHTWAPDIIKVGDKWYLYYSCSTFGKNISAIGVAVNKTLNPTSDEYKWEDLGMVIKSEPGVNDWNAIDPNVIIDRNGNPWMTFGSFWDGIQLMRLKKDMKTPAETSRTIARRHEAGEPGKRPANAIEAPFIVERDGWYYLFVSHDYCCKGLKSDYKTVVGRSRDIDGPYLDHDGNDMAQGGGTLLIGPNDRYSGVGHCGVYKFGDRWIFAAHGYDKEHHGASKLVLRDITWDADGWPSLRAEPED